MEKTSILDFISKLTGAENNRQSDGGNAAGKTDENRTNGDFDGAKAANTEKNISGEQKSFMKSYNPFTLAESDKRQITSPRAVKPPKSTIDLKNGKNLASEKKERRQFGYGKIYQSAQCARQTNKEKRRGLKFLIFR